MMGRPPLDCTVHRIRLTLSLREGEDDDLIEWFKRIPPRGRAAAVAQALRNGGAAQILEEIDQDDAEIVDELDELFF